VRPAINVGISVSRVGGNAQIKAMRSVAGKLRLDLAQYRALAAFAQFGSDLDKATQAQLTRGERMVELLKQEQFVPMPVEQQVISIWAGTQGHLDDVPTAAVRRFEREWLAFVEKNYSEVPHNVRNTKALGGADEQRVRAAAPGSVKLLLAGRKGRDYFRRRRAPVLAAHAPLPTEASLEFARELTQDLIGRFLSGEADRVELMFTQFISALRRR